MKYLAWDKARVGDILYREQEPGVEYTVLRVSLIMGTVVVRRVTPLLIKALNRVEFKLGKYYKKDAQDEF